MLFVVMQPPPPPRLPNGAGPGDGSGHSRLPIIMSALVYPGVGQLMQKRWIAGTFWILVFTAAFAWFVWELARILVAFYSQAFSDTPAVASPGMAHMLIAFGATMLGYAASLLDTVLAQARARRRG